MKKKRNNGITLVALVITIIILLILAGISIQSITNTGLFANAKRAKDESMKGQLQEEISLAIQSIQTEEIYKGKSVTLETLAGGQLEEALTDITAELDGDEINGEYKNYEYTIDSNDITKKPSIESSNAWWLRSPSHNGSGFFSGLYTRRRMFF